MLESENMRTIILVLVAMLVNCASFREHIRENYCNYEGAYTAGMNDATSGARMNNGLASLCPEVSKVEVQRGYREGYTNGQKSKPAQLNLNIRSPG
ncbi:MAG: hypothetical protein WCK42_04260 [Myxococcaceae bacterium]